MKTGHQCKTNHTVLRIRREDCQALQVRILPVPQTKIMNYAVLHQETKKEERKAFTVIRQGRY